MPAILPKPGNSKGGPGMILERESLAISEVSHLVNVHPKPIIRLLPAASSLLWKTATAPWVINRYFEPAETNPWNWLFQSFLVTVIFHITLLLSHSVGCFYMNCQFLQSCLVTASFYFNFVCHQNFIHEDNLLLVLYFKTVGTIKYSVFTAVLKTT